MKHTSSSRSLPASFLLFFATAITASAALPSMCPNPGWAEGLATYTDLKTPFPTQDTANNPHDCEFHEWSWEAFVWATAIMPDVNVPRFVTLPTEADFTKMRAAKERATTLVLKPRSLKPKGMQQDIDEFQQAGSGGVVVDQDGQGLFYSVHMNEAYLKFAKQYYGVAAYQKAPATLDFPVGAAVFKAAWKVVPDPTKLPSGFYTTTATVPMLVNNPKGKGVVADPSGATRKVTVAFIGLHVVGVTVNHPEFLWGTFEQVNNAPSLADPNNPTSSDPVSPNNFTLYKGGTAAKACNVNASPSVADATAQTLAPVTNVFLQNQYGGADPENVTDIKNINEQSQSYVKKMKGQEVFANYTLIGTVWLHAGALQPGDGTLNEISVGSPALANSCMETFVQGVPANKQSCFMCHNTQGYSKFQIPGKNINLSHVILGPLFNSPAAKKKEIK